MKTSNNRIKSVIKRNADDNTLWYELVKGDFMLADHYNGDKSGVISEFYDVGPASYMNFDSMFIGDDSEYSQAINNVTNLTMLSERVPAAGLVMAVSVIVGFGTSVGGIVCQARTDEKESVNYKACRALTYLGGAIGIGGSSWQMAIWLRGPALWAGTFLGDLILAAWSYSQLSGWGISKRNDGDSTLGSRSNLSKRDDTYFWGSVWGNDMWLGHRSDFRRANEAEHNVFVNAKEWYKEELAQKINPHNNVYGAANMVSAMSAGIEDNVISQCIYLAKDGDIMGVMGVHSRLMGAPTSLACGMCGGTQAIADALGYQSMTC